MNPSTEIEAAIQSFEVTDLKSANWVVRKINECRAYADDVKAWAQSESERAKNDEASLRARFGAELEEVARLTLFQTHARKTVSLPAGKIGFRIKAETLEIQDEEAAIEWAKINCPTAVKVTLRITKTELMAHFRENGEQPDGCVYVHESDEFFVRPNPNKGEIEDDLHN